MACLYRIIHKLVPEKIRLARSRRAIQRGYGKDISAARRAKKFDEVAELQRAQRFEMELQQELEDSYITSGLLQKARQLRVPIPYIRASDNTQSDLWYEGRQIGGWLLTTTGIRFLRQEIRQEIKKRHESRSRFFAWITAMTGVIGAVTALVSALLQNG